MTARTAANRTKQVSLRRPLAVVSRQGALSDFELRLENVAYGGTGGVSRNNEGAGFKPAYRNIRTGQTVMSRFADGSQAPIHVLDGVPTDWVIARDEDGRVCRVLSTIVSGFMYHGRFYTREAAARALSTENPA